MDFDGSTYVAIWQYCIMFAVWEIKNCTEIVILQHNMQDHGLHNPMLFNIAPIARALKEDFSQHVK